MFAIFVRVLAAIVTGLMLASPGWAQQTNSNAFPAYGNAYNHNSGPVANYPNWMSHIPDTQLLATLSIPGTHDSGTYNACGGDSFQTQSMSIPDQLTSGIRFLDIRVRSVSNYYKFKTQGCSAVGSPCASYSLGCDLWVYHAWQGQQANFNTDVLQPVINFLIQNNSETVIMRLASEYDTTDVNGTYHAIVSGSFPASNGKTVPFANYIMNTSCATGFSGGGGNVLPLSSYTSYNNFQPIKPPTQLGPVNTNGGPSANPCDARGRVIILPELWGVYTAVNYYQNYGKVVSETYDEQKFRNGSTDTFDGICQSGDVDCLSSNWDLYNKWLAAQSHLNWVNTNRQFYYNGTFYVHHLNGNTNGLGFPYFFASGKVSPNGLALATGATTPGWPASYDPDFPRVNCLGSLCTIAFEGMNQLVANYLNGVQMANGQQFAMATNNGIGIVQSDFPGTDLIAAIMNLNIFAFPNNNATNVFKLQANQWLAPQITSPNGRYSLNMQTDGNVVLRRNIDGTPLWATNTSGSNGAIMGGDGNFVVLSQNGTVWNSNASCCPAGYLQIQDAGSYLQIQDDGNLVIINPIGNPIWATNTGR